MRPVPQPVKALCAARGIRNTELAAQIGVSAHHVGRVLNGQVQPSARLRDRCAKALGVPASDLFRDPVEEAVGSTADDVLSLLKRTRSERGLALVIDDPAIIAKVAALVAGAGGAGRGVA